MNKMGKVVKYEVSEDKKGLLAYFNTGEFYHVHNNEMDSLQKWIHKLLRDRAKCIEILEKYYRMNIYGNKEIYHDRSHTILE
jgi:hypothetical protein